MTNTVVMTCLVENSVYAAGLRAEHGLSIFIELGEATVLLDAGQTSLATENARTLDVDLARVTDLVVSHGHYDHTGGLAQVLAAAESPRVHAHPAAFEPKFAKREDGHFESIGAGLRADDVCSRGGELVLSAGPNELAPGVWTSGEIPRTHRWEKTNGAFFLDTYEQSVDSLIDDQCLFLDAPEGPIIFTGCAHSGIVNMMEYVAELTGRSRIHAVVGGIHLVSAASARIEKTIEAFHRFDVQRVILGHCTGFKALRRFWDAFEERCFLLNVGARFIFESGG